MVDLSKSFRTGRVVEAAPHENGGRVPLCGKTKDLRCRVSLRHALGGILFKSQIIPNP